jgi:branched-chain amino acid transport system permease protein
MSDFVDTYNNLLLSIGTNGLLALSMYVALRSGVFSVATIGAAALGAYGSALATIHLGVPTAVALAIGVVAALTAVVFLAAPVLRLSYMYLAIATLAFNEIVRYVAVQAEFTGGASGLGPVPPTVGLTAVYGSLLVAIGCFIVFERSSFGRLTLAAGADPVVVSGLGYPAGRVKLYALVVSLGLAGLAGGLTVHHSYLVAPDDYGFGLVTAVLSFVILGGLTAFWGPLLGMVMLTVLPEVLRFAGEYRLLVDGMIVILVVILYPQGLVGLVRQVTGLVRRVAAATRRPPLDDPVGVADAKVE